MSNPTATSAKSTFKIEVSDDGTTWVDISCTSSSVKVSGGEQAIGEVNTACSAEPIVTGSGKVSARIIEVNALYTETAVEAWRLVADRFASANKTIFLRYSPNGGNSGDALFTVTSDLDVAIAAPIISANPPEGDASTGDPKMFIFSVMASKLSESVIA